MNKTLFNTELMTYEERKENIDRELSTEFFEEINRDDINKGRTMAESYSGWFSDRIAQYLVHSHDIDNPGKTEYPFFANDHDYYRTGQAKAILLTDQLDSWVDPLSWKKYEIERYSDKDEYIQHLFGVDNLAVNDLRRFIRMGLHKSLKGLDLEDYSFRTIQGLKKLQMIIQMGCTKNTDKTFLNYFDGDRSINDIADIYGITHQNVTKKITRICKNALKKVRTQEGCTGLNEEVDNKLSA
ncbi:hypothetical protein DKZ29_06095 [Limosilactobacillus reuteri]|uniref:Sigma-70 family RNA polymerase sigma factor n=2 Tax=Limosilactobacillus reuteri TaxID=1598 RepID=A0ABD6Y872_LIMRT|nr:hypothetical protein [Limosilactobacillus reuteri]PWT35282.1 hypothetical protein DKZ24_04300 [Limosilactobacillus reuteri]PWT37936.1 hypothetical protein DKZ35_03045 [Limosilactobacillus reuteri]PWT55724.1 hypothetical protein DKZ31_01140 [Limosilactobacillus reuteri]PWT58335.1 hypothetical protein DKZ29_06095 [Limosilactobacillus reuteri]PWT59993.1 hypothetical protein DKZ30_04220 [Limosilactobacillus reuteri]